MSKLPAQTTGYVNNGGVVTYAPNNTAEQLDILSIDRPQRALRWMVEGDYPSDKDGTDMSVSVFDGTIPLFSAVGTWGVQGQSTAGADKKNVKFKLKNPNTGNKLALKIGDWFSATSITHKAYGTDRTLIRESTATELYRRIHAYPTGLLASPLAYSYFDGIDFGTHTKALFSTAGTVAEIYRNGTFCQLGVIRSDADNPDYLMDDGNPNHILIQPQHAGGIWQNVWSGSDWVVQSPAIKGYDDQDDISKSAPDVQAKCQAILTYMQGCIAGTIDVRSTHTKYLRLRDWLDYDILINLTGSFDSMTNNFMFGTWDGVKWGPWPYDLDETAGLVFTIAYDGAWASNIGWVTEKGGKADQDPGFFDVIHRQFRPELRARWRDLRDARIISIEAITSIINQQVGLINPDLMAQDIALWPLDGATGAPSWMPLGGKWSVSYVIDWYKARVAWIDQQWGYSG